MNKIAYIAALAAVPAIVAPAHAEVSSAERIAVAKTAYTIMFIKTVTDDDLPLSKKIETMEELAAGVELVNRVGVPDDLFASAVDLVGILDEDALEHLGDYAVAVIEELEKSDFYGSPKLKATVIRFFEAILAD